MPANQRTAANQPPRVRAIWIVGTVICFGLALWIAGEERRGFDRLPGRARAALADRTLADLRMCREAGDDDLEGFCRQAAMRALALPECGSECRALAQPWRGGRR